VPSTPRAVTRRTAVGGLVAAAATTLSGCHATGVDRRPRATLTPLPSRRPGVDPDVALAAVVLRHERAMLARVRATADRHPTLADTLAGARAAHRAHVDLLVKAVPDETSSASPSAAEPASPTTGAAVPRVPERAAAALSALARAEERLSLTGRRSSFAAESGAFARVLASMAAAASQQGVHLVAAAQEGR
jgi:hypothetical protein